jgi:hypothetical protein
MVLGLLRYVLLGAFALFLLLLIQMMRRDLE